MKKGLKMAAAAVLALTILSGCSAKEEKITSGIASADKFEDMQKGESVESEDLNIAFTKAIDKIKEVDSATIDMEVGVNLTENGEELSNTNITKIMIMDKVGSEAEATTAAEGESSETPNIESESEPKVALVDMTNEGNGETQNIAGYFDEDKFYYTVDGQKVIRPMSYEELMAVFASYDLQFSNEVIENAVKVESKDETKYSVKFNPESMANMMINNLTSQGASLDPNEGLDVETAYLYFVVDKDGFMKGYDMELNAQFTTANGEAESENATGEGNSDGITNSPFKYSIVTNFSDINATKVEPYSDLDTYRDINEVIAEMQAEQESAQTNETGEETVTTEANSNN